MYFAKLEGNDIVSIHNGSFDYVHRITGAPMTGAVRLPENCVQITGAEYDELLQHLYSWNYQWDAAEGKIVKVNANGLEYKIGLILDAERAAFINNRRAELGAMTEAELDAILAGGA